MNEELLKSIYESIGGSNIGPFEGFLEAFNTSEDVRTGVYNKLGGEKVGTFDSFLIATGAAKVETEKTITIPPPPPPSEPEQPQQEEEAVTPYDFRNDPDGIQYLARMGRRRLDYSGDASVVGSLATPGIDGEETMIKTGPIPVPESTRVQRPPLFTELPPDIKTLDNLVNEVKSSGMLPGGLEKGAVYNNFAPEDWGQLTEQDVQDAALSYERSESAFLSTMEEVIPGSTALIGGSFNPPEEEDAGNTGGQNPYRGVLPQDFASLPLDQRNDLIKDLRKELGSMNYTGKPIIDKLLYVAQNHDWVSRNLPTLLNLPTTVTGAGANFVLGLEVIRNGIDSFDDNLFTAAKILRESGDLQAAQSYFTKLNHFDRRNITDLSLEQEAELYKGWDKVSGTENYASTKLKDREQRLQNISQIAEWTKNNITDQLMRESELDFTDIRNAGDIFTYAFQGMAGFGPSMAIGAATLGTGFVAMVAGMDYQTQVEAAAEATEADIDSIVKSGIINDWVPILTGTAAGLLETYGLAKLGAYILSSPLKGGLKEASKKYGTEGLRQATINWMEAGLNKLNQIRGEGIADADQEEVLIDALKSFEWMISEEGIDAGIKAMAGSMLMTGPKFVRQTFQSNASRYKAIVDTYENLEYNKELELAQARDTEVRISAASEGEIPYNLRKIKPKEVIPNKNGKGVTVVYDKQELINKKVEVRGLDLTATEESINTKYKEKTKEAFKGMEVPTDNDIAGMKRDLHELGRIKVASVAQAYRMADINNELGMLEELRRSEAAKESPSQERLNDLDAQMEVRKFQYAAEKLQGKYNVTAEGDVYAGEIKLGTLSDNAKRHLEEVGEAAKIVAESKAKEETTATEETVEQETPSIQQELLNAVETLGDTETRTFRFDSLDAIPEGVRGKAKEKTTGKKSVKVYGKGLTGLVNSLLGRGEETTTPGQAYYELEVTGAELREIARSETQQQEGTPVAEQSPITVGDVFLEGDNKYEVLSASDGSYRVRRTDGEGKSSTLRLTEEQVNKALSEGEFVKAPPQSRQTDEQAATQVDTASESRQEQSAAEQSQTTEQTEGTSEGVTTTLPGAKTEGTYVKVGNEWFKAKNDGTPSKIAVKKQEFIDHLNDASQQKSQVEADTVATEQQETATAEETKSTPPLFDRELPKSERKILADKIRSLKASGDKLVFSDPFLIGATLQIGKTLYNKAVDMIAEQVENGTKLGNAIGNAVKFINEQMAGKPWDRAAFAKAMNARYSVTLPDGRQVDVERDDSKEAAEVINGWYMPIEQVILDTKQEKLPAKEWAKRLRSKDDEDLWTGVREFLESKGTESVTKKELQDFIKENRVEIVEVVKGDKLKEYQEKRDNALLKANELRKKANEINYEAGGKDKSTQEKMWAEADALEKQAVQWEIEADRFEGFLSTGDTGAKFTQYQLEGEKENYKVVLVTLPSRTKEASYTIFKDGDEWKARNDQTGKISSGGWKSEIQAELWVEGRSGEVYDTKSNFKSSHFDEPNILVHLRMNTRTAADGSKVLFLEELQSDWGQKGKREGFKISEAEQKARNYYPTQGVPQAPFVTSTPSWVKLGIKTAIKEAVAQGATKIAWTTGEQQFNRWGSEKIDWVKNTEFNKQEHEEIIRQATKKRNEYVKSNERLGLLPMSSSSEIKSFKEGKTKEADIIDTRIAKIERYKDTVRNNKDWLAANDAIEELVNEKNKIRKQISENFKGIEEQNEIITSAEQDLKNYSKWNISIQEQVSGTAFEGMNIDEKALSESGIKINSKEDLKAAIDRTLSREKTETERQKLTDRIWDRMQKEDKGTSLPRKEGMEGFYDVTVRDVAKAVVKELTGKEGVAGEVQIRNNAVNENYKYIKNSREGGKVVVEYAGAKEFFDDFSSAQEWVDKNIGTGTAQQSIEITPELKASVEMGAPMFKISPETARSFAQKVRSAKVKPGQMLASGIPFGAQAWNLALETVALAIEGGAALAEAIQKGLNALEKTKDYKNLKADEKQVVANAFKRKVSDEVAPIASDKVAEAKDEVKKASDDLVKALKNFVASGPLSDTVGFYSASDAILVRMITANKDLIQALANYIGAQIKLGTAVTSRSLGKLLRENGIPATKDAVIRILNEITESIDPTHKERTMTSVTDAVMDKMLEEDHSNKTVAETEALEAEYKKKAKAAIREAVGVMSPAQASVLTKAINRLKLTEPSRAVAIKRIMNAINNSVAKRKAPTVDTITKTSVAQAKQGVSDFVKGMREQMERGKFEKGVFKAALAEVLNVIKGAGILAQSIRTIAKGAANVSTPAQLEKFEQFVLNVIAKRDYKSRIDRIKRGARRARDKKAKGAYSADYGELAQSLRYDPSWTPTAKADRDNGFVDLNRYDAFIQRLLGESFSYAENQADILYFAEKAKEQQKQREKRAEERAEQRAEEPAKEKTPEPDTPMRKALKDGVKNKRDNPFLGYSDAYNREMDTVSSLTDAEIDNMTNAELATIIDNLTDIEAGYRITAPFAQLVSRVLNNRSVEVGKRAIKDKTFKMRVRDMVKFWRWFSKESYRQDNLKAAIADRPLSKLDSVFNGRMGNELYKTFIQPISVAYSSFMGKVNNLASDLEKLRRNVTSDENILLSLIALDKQDKKNPDNAKAPSLEKILTQVRAAGNSDSKYKIYADYYQKIYDDNSVNGIFDWQTAYNNLSPKAKELFDYVEKLHEENAHILASATARNETGTTIIDAYSPLKVKLRDLGDISEMTNNFIPDSIDPSPAKSTIERTGTTNAVYLDFAGQAFENSRELYKDFFMRAPLKTFHNTMNELVNMSPDTVSIEEKDFYRALHSSIRDQVKAVFMNTYIEGNATLSFIRESGYYSALASLPRGVAELTSNLPFAALVYMRSFVTGAQTMAADSMPSFLGGQKVNYNKFFEFSGTTHYSRLVEGASVHGDMLGRLDKPKIKGVEKGIKSLKVLNNARKSINRALIERGDTIVAQPLWVGSFKRAFKKSSGAELDLVRFTEDAAYRHENRKHIEAARDTADANLSQGFSTFNPFDSIASVQGTTSDNWFQAYNKFLTRFVRYEFQSMSDAVTAMMGNDATMTPIQGSLLLVGTLMRMGIYTVMAQLMRNLVYGSLVTVLNSMTGSNIPQPGADDEEEYLRKFYRSSLGGALSLTIGRRMGNVGRILPMYLIELGNKAYGEEIGLRPEGEEYNKYIHAIVWSFLAVEGAQGKPSDTDSKIVEMGIALSGPFQSAAKGLRDAANQYSRSAELKTPEAKERARALTWYALARAGTSITGVPFTNDALKMLNIKAWHEHPPVNDKKFTPTEAKSELERIRGMLTEHRKYANEVRKELSKVPEYRKATLKQKRDMVNAKLDGKYVRFKIKKNDNGIETLMPDLSRYEKRVTTIKKNTVKE